MKNIFLYTIVAAFTLGGAAASAQTLPPGWPFPDRTERTNKKDKRDRNERVITDRDGRVINRHGRVYRNDGNLPPGQAKKKYGSKSAKVYAPGQRKKAERNDDIFERRRDRDDDRRVSRERDVDIFGNRRDRDDDDDDDDWKEKKKKKNKNKKK